MTLVGPDRDPIIAPEAERPALRELARLFAEGADGTLTVGDASGRCLTLPPTAAHLLRRLVDVLAADEAASIVSLPRKLTPRQAADLLVVPSASLLKLLDEGTIASEQVAAERWVRIEDLLTYKARRDAERRAALLEMVRLSEEMGLYELEAEGKLVWPGVPDATDHSGAA